MNKVELAIWGFVYGDAFGVPVEFLKRDTYEIKTLEGFGSWPVPAGTWSDDSAMVFITMDHFIKQSSSNDLKRAFCDWAYRGFWTFNHEPSFDVGATISEVLFRWEHKSIEEKAQSDEFSNGNGALMRIVPVSLKCYQNTDKEIVQMIEQYATLTHGHIRSTLCSLHYTYFLHALLDGQDLRTSLTIANEKLAPKFVHYEQERQHFERLFIIDTLQRHEIKSTGYVIDTIEAVYWSLFTSSSYYDAIAKAVHLGNDTDTIGAITGAIAGIYYGTLNIPIEWASMIPRRNDIIELIHSFEEVVK